MNAASLPPTGPGPVGAPRWVATSYPQRTRFGAGALDSVAEALKEAGGRRALLVTSERAANGEDGRLLARRLGRTLAAVFTGVRPHLPSVVLQQAMGAARAEGVDAVVSLGGGAAVDLGKALVHFTELERGTPGTSFVDRPALVHVAVPTTYAGAECSPLFAVTDDRTRAKATGGSPTCLPLAVVLDPALFVDLPPRLGAAGAIGALAGAVEAAAARDRTAEAEVLALAAVARVVAALPAVLDEPGSVEARTALLAATHLAARARAGASVGVHDGLAHLLGGRTGIPHGVASAVLLPHTLRFNGDAMAAADLAAVGAALGAADDPAGAAAALLATAGVPTRLRDVGVDEEDLDAVARLSGRSPAILRNARPAGEADVRAILEDAW